MRVSKAEIRHAELIRRVHLWREDKRRRVLLALFSLPKDPASISHSACYVFSPNEDHLAPFDSFPNLTGILLQETVISRRRPPCYWGEILCCQWDWRSKMQLKGLEMLRAPEKGVGRAPDWTWKRHIHLGSATKGSVT